MSILDYKTKLPGYYPSAWAVECGGPRRQKLVRSAGPGFEDGTDLTSTVRRMDGWAVMLVQRETGELFAQGGGGLHGGELPPHYRPEGDNHGWLERIDPISLQTIVRSPELPSGGHLWCGAVVVHENGDLYMVNGRYAHRLNPSCEVLAERKLPVDGPYNGLLIMSDGNLVMKNLGHKPGEPCQFSVLEPERLEPIGDPFIIDEHCMGRFSSDLTTDGEFLYTSSATQLYRLRYENGALSLDSEWRGNYDLPGENQGDGWDTSIGSDSVWLMDMGRPPFWQEQATAPQRAFRFSIDNPDKPDVVDVIGRPNTFSPGPPLYDPERKILVVYDGSNGGVVALRYQSPSQFEPLWRNEFRNNVQMMLYPDTGELVLEDASTTRAQNKISDAVVVDIESGSEKGRAPTGAAASMGMFLCPGFERDFYVATLPGMIARVFAA
jgi:hypothetical protein